LLLGPNISVGMDTASQIAQQLAQAVGCATDAAGRLKSSNGGLAHASRPTGLQMHVKHHVSALQVELKTCQGLCSRQLQPLQQPQGLQNVNWVPEKGGSQLLDPCSPTSS
jgi:hypothetical protein